MVILWGWETDSREGGSGSWGLGVHPLPSCPAALCCTQLRSLCDPAGTGLPLLRRPQWEAASLWPAGKWGRSFSHKTPFPLSGADPFLGPSTMSQARRRATSVRLFAGLRQEAPFLLSEGHPWAEGHLWVEGRLTAGTGLSCTALCPWSAACRALVRCVWSRQAPLSSVPFRPQPQVCSQERWAPRSSASRLSWEGLKEWLASSRTGRRVSLDHPFLYSSWHRTQS